uniref:Rab-GAP TBC domain-containing protein n=1 Tax=Acrobeloides nanus TaxID=290746 RepID=A0A914DA08_9BILA
MLDRRKRKTKKFVWTQKRLRTENRLLRQRIDYLEHESSALADKLIRGQVDLAQQADNHLNIMHELNLLRDINSDAHRKLEGAYETIRELSSKRNEDLSLIETGTQVDDTTMIEHIHSLQQDMIEAHTKKADLENTVRELKLRIQDLESANKRLKESPPDGGIASIQEELIRVKMREAEASLSLKEMRQRLAELEQHWAKYVASRALNGAQSPLPQSQSMTSVDTAGVSNDSRAESPQHSPNSSTASATQAATPNGTSSAPQTARARLSKLTAFIGAAAGAVGASTSSDASEQGHGSITIKDLEDQLMGLRIREADAIAELKEMRQKVMELETQNHVCTNQLKRQDDEMKRIKEEKEVLSQSEKEAVNHLKEEQRKLLEVQTDLKEKNVMQRLKYTEAIQNIADLKQYIAQLESKSAEKLAHAQVRGSSIVDLDDESITSRRSVGSYGDANSIASEEMSAFIADVTTKIPSDLASSDSDDGNKSDVETETEQVGERKTIVIYFNGI